MAIPPALLNGIKKKTKTAGGVQPVTLKKSINKKEFGVCFNLITCQVRVFQNGRMKGKEVDLDLWAKFQVEGRQRMKASAYRAWCEANDRDSSQPVQFNTKNGPILRIAEYYQQAKTVEWVKLGPATNEIIKSHTKVW
jgi:hypothetical protein